MQTPPPSHERSKYKKFTLYADDYHGVLDWFGSDRDSKAVKEFVCGKAISIIYRGTEHNIV